jgi:carboxymethylenebutenolidase
MKSFIASDGHQFSAYQSEPATAPRGVVIIIQEIFGITDHLCETADKLAKEGYIGVVPAFFDRLQPGIQLTYNDTDQGRELAMQLDPDQVILDIAAVNDSYKILKVAVMGFCWGGTLAYLAASQLNINAGIAYYGTRIHQNLDQKPACPFLFQFGAKDHLVSVEDIEAIRQENSDATFYVYEEAGHAFNCEPRESFHRESADLSWERSLDFLQQHLD